MFAFRGYYYQQIGPSALGASLSVLNASFVDVFLK